MRKTIFFILFAFSSLIARSQSVGLVLSGGGAKGLYHIGLIKALEENNVPIDYIAGTSMGAIIAGLYSAGYSADEMIYMFTHENVQGWVTGKIEDKYLFYYSKESIRPALFSSTIDIKSMLKSAKDGADEAIDDIYSSSVFPKTAAASMPFTNLVNTNQLDLQLMGYFAPSNAYCKGDFNNLFVPFRCVASDVIKKKQYVWEKGDLAKAVRSSMSIPIIFNPMTHGDMVLYDGGVYNNFPWRDMQEIFKPDFIIGGRCVAAVSGNNSSITGQIELLVMEETDYNIPADMGLVVGRDVPVGLLDFTNPMPTIEMGYQDAMAMMDSIQKKVPRVMPQESVERRRMAFKSKLPALEFSGNSVEKLNDIIVHNRGERDFLGDTLYIKTYGKNLVGRPFEESYSFEHLKELYYRTVTDRDMKSNFPFAHYDMKSGLFDFDVELSSVPEFSIRGGLNVSSSSINQAYLGLLYQNNRKNRALYYADGYLGSFYNSVNLSTRHNFYDGKVPLYFKNQLVYNHIDYANANNQKITYNSLFSEGNYYSNETYFSSTLGMKMMKDGKAEFIGSLGRDRIRFSDKLIEQEEEAINEKARVNYASLSFSVDVNTLNYPAYPTKGLKMRFGASLTFGGLKWEVPNADSETGYEMLLVDRMNWTSLSYNREQYFKISKNFTFGYLASAVWTNLPDLGSSYIRRSLSPRFTPTEFSKTLFLPEFQSESFIGGGAIPVFEVNSKLYLKGGLFVYKPDILNWEFYGEKVKYLTSATAVYQSPLGPISLSYNNLSVSSAKENYLIFGFGYMIFNNRGIIY